MSTTETATRRSNRADRSTRTGRTTRPSRRSPFARGGGEPTGPRATFRQLLPFLFEHRPVLIWVAVLSVIGALTSLAQPLLVAQVINIVEAGETLGWIVWGLVALVIISGVISGYQHYLLQRTGEGVVLSSRKQLIGKILRLPIAEFDTRRTGDLVSRVGSDTTMLRAVLTQGLVEAIGGTVTFVGALIAMLIIDPVLLGLTVARRGHRRHDRHPALAPRTRSLARGTGEGGRRRRVGRARDQRGAHHPGVGRDRSRGPRRRGRGRGRLDHGRSGREDLGPHRSGGRHRHAGVVPRGARRRRIPGGVGGDHRVEPRRVHPLPLHDDPAPRPGVRRDHLGEPRARRARPHPGGPRPARRRRARPRARPARAHGRSRERGRAARRSRHRVRRRALRLCNDPVRPRRPGQ